MVSPGWRRTCQRERPADWRVRLGTRHAPGEGVGIESGLDLLAGFVRQGGAEVALAGATADGNKQLALVFGAIRSLQGRPNVGAGGNAREDSHFEGEAAGGGEGVFVAGGIRDRDAQFGQFRLDAPTAPGRIGLPHAADQADQITIERPPSSRQARFPTPEAAEACPMPSHDGARLNDYQHPLPP